MLPTDEEIQNLSRTGDVFRFAIVGFSATELALEELISDSLLTSHSVELTRLSIDFKVDLAIGLGLLSRDSKGLLIKLSKIRNFYAHEFNVGTDYCPHQELKSCLSNVHRKIIGEYFDKADNFKEVLRISFIAAYYELIDLIARQQASRKKRAEALFNARAILEVIAPKDKDEEFNEIRRSASYEKLSKEVEEKKKELFLRETGKPSGKPEVGS